MKVFISWSGRASRGVAEALRNWLPDVLQAVEPFVSSYDIGAGDRVPETLQRELAETNFGILCLTPANHQAPWVLFEAGALAKTFEEGRICPYLINLKPHELKQPLALYQAKTADKSGTLSLVKAINKALLEGQLSEARLEKCFERWWPEFNPSLEGFEIELAPAQTFQHFFLVQKSTGRCLQAVGPQGKDGAEIKLETYSDIDRQKWSFHYVGKGLLAIVSRYSDLCIDVEKHSEKSGARAHQWAFRQKNNQLWTIDKGAQIEAGVRLKVEHTGFYLSARESGAIQIDGSEGDDRLWYLQPAL
jgi:hypothetical protein